MEIIKARIITPTKEQVKTALKACADPVYLCHNCYLRPFTNEGRLSTGERCRQHLALDACEMLDEEEPRPDLSDIAADLMIANAENKQLKEELKAAKIDLYKAGDCTSCKNALSNGGKCYGGCRGLVGSKYQYEWCGAPSGATP